LELCRASQWNQLRRDWECFLNLNPSGCRVAIKGDRVVGTVATLKYSDVHGGDAFSWIAMVLVDSAERRQGIGSQLMREALGCLEDQATIRLDATPAGHSVYVQLGFADEYELTRMELTASHRSIYSKHASTRLAQEADLPQITELDSQVFGADRGMLLKWLFAGAREYSRVCIRDGKVIGYLFGRHGFKYEHLGPVIAGDRGTARLLIEDCLSDHATVSFILDASRHDPEWVRCLASLGFRELRPFIRMYRGEYRCPGIPGRQFAILGPEFG
jgi:predicted N-acetyltransferase YhbS